MNSLANEKGFASLLVVFSVLAIGSLVVVQMSTAFNGNLKQNAYNRMKANTHIHLINLAQQFKRAYDLAEIQKAIQKDSVILLCPLCIAG